MKEWKELPVAISVKDEGVYEPKFTNMFLLQHCSQSYELFHIRSEEQYRLLYELKRVFESAEVNANAQAEPIYQIEGGKAVWVHEGVFDILDENGNKLTSSLRISDFNRHPRQYFNLIAEQIK